MSTKLSEANFADANDIPRELSPSKNTDSEESISSEVNDPCYYVVQKSLVRKLDMTLMPIPARYAASFLYICGCFGAIAAL
ncbi:allantoate permease [Fusarium mundagurra]|uniref:Allantoate permease n=1 Tax=Fusarium mundagurra TaxID=1567541 RepID=A0A8H6DME5_9HYPO|nr:allantoate permease [Fusarium mundagurra]